jgi:pullulanase/glycogen debranching enzyme
MRIWPGSPYPSGTTWDNGGANLPILAAEAERVELCLADSPGATKEVADLFDDTLLILINASVDANVFALPPHQKGQRWAKE